MFGVLFFPLGWGFVFRGRLLNWQIGSVGIFVLVKYSITGLFSCRYVCYWELQLAKHVLLLAIWWLFWFSLENFHALLASLVWYLPLCFILKICFSYRFISKCIPSLRLSLLLSEETEKVELCLVCGLKYFISTLFLCYERTADYFF